MSVRYFIGVAARDHVGRGLAGGFAQVSHGRRGPLQRMAPGDWIAYYSGKETHGAPKPCRAFTAIGRIRGETAYQVELGNGFAPFRRDVEFLESIEAPIEPLIERLGFIVDKRRWGYPFRRGYLEVDDADFRLIAGAMGVETR